MKDSKDFLSVYRVDAALDYWVKRFERLKVEHSGIEEQFGKKVISLTILTIKNIN